MKQNDINTQNAQFWNELCGSIEAKALGITDASPASLQKFDAWYFEFYPYLNDFIPFEHLKGKKVLDIGLGYGSVAQKLVEAGADYTGLDIATNPVEIVNQRIDSLNLEGKAQQGTILNPDFPDESFDIIIAFGCLHHTGDLLAAINQCHRLLKPNGTLIGMVYSAYSYRRWFTSPLTTAHYYLNERKGMRKAYEAGSKKSRAQSDSNLKGEAAPHVEFISKTSLAAYLKDFSKIELTYENIGQELFYRFTPRSKMIKSPASRRWGLDLYFTAVK